MFEWRVHSRSGGVVIFTSDSPPVGKFDDSRGVPVWTSEEILGPIVTTEGTRYVFPWASIAMLEVVPKARPA